MFETLESGIGLDIILWFQNNRTGWMEVLSEIFGTLGGELGYIAIFGLVYWTINRKHGIRLVFALVTIAMVTFAFKDMLMRPRPFIAHPDIVTPVFETEGFGLPSGHTSFAVMIWGYIALWVRKTWMWIFAIFYMILQGTMRMVAGVHFPQDVLLGMILGIVTLAIYMPLVPRWLDFWQAQNTTIKTTLALTIPLVISAIVIAFPLDMAQTEAYLTLLGLAPGAGLGAILEPRLGNFTPASEPFSSAIIFVLGLVLTVAVTFGLSPLFDAIAETGVLAHGLRIVRYGLAGFVAIALVPYLGVRMNLMESQQAPADTVTAT